MSARRRTLTRGAALACCVLATVALTGCGSADDVATASAPPAVQRFPDVLSAELVPDSDGRYDVVVTVSSPYDTPQRYADGWRVLAPDGSVLGAHTLLHDHAGEQPFTRTQRGLVIPADVDRVTVQGRDLVHGYGGGTVDVTVPPR